MALGEKAHTWIAALETLLGARHETNDTDCRCLPPTMFVVRDRIPIGGMCGDDAGFSSIIITADDKHG